VTRAPSDTLTLPERLLVLHAALRQAGLPHAFGGAIALAYWTQEPRGTRDLDVNVFVPQASAARVIAALPAGVVASPAAIAALADTGQVRLFWDDTPIDLFLDYAPLHAQAARHVEWVPFEGERIPVLGPTELAIFKLLFDRTKDWADVEAMLEADQLDVAAVRDSLRTLLGDDDPRLTRLAETVRRAGR
jgi:Nucleotidyl transferase AbiEii toxin, Type IV TA system